MKSQYWVKFDECKDLILCRGRYEDLNAYNLLICSGAGGGDSRADPPFEWTMLRRRLTSRTYS